MYKLTMLLLGAVSILPAGFAIAHVRPLKETKEITFKISFPLHFKGRVVSGTESSQNRVVLRKWVSMGFISGNVKGWCIGLSGYMSSHEFFEGLEETDKTSGPQFRKEGKAVQLFPRVVFVGVEAGVNRCPGGRSTNAGGASEATTMNSIHFVAQWKRGLELRPAKIISVKVASADRAALLEQEAPTWTYSLKILSKDVPLSDHLIISVFAGDGQRLGRFSGKI